MHVRIRRDQIKVLVAKDFKLKYNSTALGFFWCLLVPFFTSLVYYLVFGVMVRWTAENYLLYLISGNFLWQFFANVVLMNGNVLIENQELLKKTSFDRGLLIWGTYFTESLHFLLTIPILILVMYLSGVHLDFLSAFPNFVVCIVSLSLFTVGISYFYAASNLWFRDLERIMTVLMMAWMFGSPIFIPISAVPAEYLWVYDINPMAWILRIWRNIFYVPCFDAELFAVPLVVGAVVYLMGRFVFRRLEPKFAEMM